MDNDLVMAGPFEEPDEYFLRRQRAAFGTEQRTARCGNPTRYEAGRINDDSTTPRISHLAFFSAFFWNFTVYCLQYSLQNSPSVSFPRYMH